MQSHQVMRHMVMGIAGSYSRSHVALSHAIPGID